METEATFAQAIGLLEGVPADPLTLLGDDEICRRVLEIERIGRIVDALRLRVAAEVEERAVRITDGTSMSLARRLGVVNGTQVLERLARISQSEAARRIRLGQQISSRVSIGGEVLPAPFPVLAQAVTAGEVGIDAVAAIVGPLAETARRADPEQLAEAERHLVDEARCGMPDLLRVQARVLSQALDPDGAEPRETELRCRRSLRIGREVNGMTPFHGLADPVGAALLRAAIADRTAPHRTPRFVADDELAVERDDEGAPIRDERLREQRAYDVLVGLLTAGIRADRDPATPLHAVATVQAVVTANDLARGSGLAWLDDVAEPVPASTAPMSTTASCSAATTTT
jgi:hypothetical protein